MGHRAGLDVSEKSKIFFPAQIGILDRPVLSLVAIRTVTSHLSTAQTAYINTCTWSFQVLRYPNFFLGNGSR